jgi:hypothetical protein
MSDANAEISEVLLGIDTIPKEKVLSWIGKARDVRTLALLYRLTNAGYYRIQPELGGEITCGVIQRYLLECIRQDIKESEEIQGRWEAAQTLHSWFCHLLNTEDCQPILTAATQAVTEVFLTSDKGVQDAIEQGFLEHALEMEGLRPYFEYWSQDERLKPAWKRAIEWGKAHPGYTWGLLQQLAAKVHTSE